MANVKLTSESKYAKIDELDLNVGDYIESSETSTIWLIAAHRSAVSLNDGALYKFRDFGYKYRKLSPGGIITITV